MSQHDFEIANQGFPATRADLNNALQALASLSAGSTEPSTTYAYQLWYDEANDLLKMRNSDDDAFITLAAFDQTNDEWEIRSAVIQAVDSAGVTIKTDEGTARITVADNGNVTIANQLTVSDGLVVDNDGATVATFDRATSDGTIVDLQKDGTTVGEIGTFGDQLYMTASASGGIRILTDGTVRPSTTSGSNNDNAIDLGVSSARWKDLYLSGGVYLGGTTSANKLEDYEEGTWTCSVVGQTATATGRYVKVGDLVEVEVKFNCDTTVTVGTTAAVISGLPFNASLDSRAYLNFAARKLRAVSGANGAPTISSSVGPVYIEWSTQATIRPPSNTTSNGLYQENIFADDSLFYITGAYRVA